MTNGQSGKLKLGINYPWYEFGWDFGLPPKNLKGDPWVPRGASWNSGGGRQPVPWKQTIDDFLECFQCIGVEVIRWYLFADCYNYGKTSWQYDTDWRVDNTDLPGMFLDDFKELLQKLQDRNKQGSSGTKLKLLPVLFSFEAFWPARQVFKFQGKDAGVVPDDLKRKASQDPAKWLMSPEVQKQIDKGQSGEAGRYKGGRGDIIRSQESTRSRRRDFFDNTLTKLLEVADAFHDEIYAWEVISEPEYALNVGKLQKQQYPNRTEIYFGKRDVLDAETPVFETWVPPFTQADLASFLYEAGKRIAAKNFDWTVGFKDFKTIGDSTWDVLNVTPSGPADTATIKYYLPQFHYYGDPAPFPTQSKTVQRLYLVGEFPLKDPAGTSDDPVWTDSTSKQANITKLADRLKVIENAGFPLALGWSARGHERDPAKDPRSAWNSDICKDLAAKNGKTVCDACSKTFPKPAVVAPAAAPSLPQAAPRPSFRPPR